MNNLKTLKDFENSIEKGIEIEISKEDTNFPEIYHDSIKELVRNTVVSTRLDYSKKLKEEAIKWIQNLKNVCDKNKLYASHYIDNKFGSYNDFDDYTDFENTINWIKQFFNITDEDLK